MNIRLKSHQKDIIYSPASIFELMKDILLRRNRVSRGRENLWVVSLDGYDRVIGVELVSMGTCNETLVCVKEVFVVH
ncbi:MAG: JAB domain-containing protein [Bacteroidetes bacterium]|nr:JAB domain-containing protein [Bacteroidota bacterium]